MSAPGGDRTVPPTGATTDVDVTRRTHLANERTYLAWWRTGLGSLAAGIATGRVVPVLTHTARIPYAIVGVGFTLLGIICVGYSYIRHRDVERALARGEFAPPDIRIVFGLALGAAVLGLIVLVIIVAES